MWTYSAVEAQAADPGDLGRVVADGTAFVWVDVRDPSDSELAELQQRLSLHPLAVEDARHRQQRPKLERYPPTTS